MKWWLEHKFRMIQNNLRDIDGGMDVDYEIAMLQKFHANVVQLGCGGISAFSETALPEQKRTPYLAGDKFGEFVQKCHENKIRVIARFDVSKVDESYEALHPEWLQRTADGSPVRYNDTVATCVNSPYQQDVTPEIIGEILRKYPVDAFFFNMFGYQTYDYSERYVGICQCESCRRRFREMYGAELPGEENTADPIYQKYLEFKKVTVDELLLKIEKTVRDINPEIGVSTYFDKGIDIIRCEANTAVDRPLPMWIYAASDYVASLEGTFADKASSCCAINAVDIPFRFMGVSDTYNRIRMLENIANGGSLDWCIIGSFEDYPDRSNYAGVEEIFGFHERYQSIFDHLHSAAKALLLSPTEPYIFGRYSAEYRGIFKMLKEAHIEFDTLIDLDTGNVRNRIADYDLVIVPGIARLRSGKIREALANYSGKVISTAGAFAEEPELLAKLHGIAGLARREGERAAYFLTEPKRIFKSFAEQDWVYQDRARWIAENGPQTNAGNSGAASEETQTGDPVVLPYISPSTFGPPERCYGHRVTDEPGALISGNGVCIPWEIGALYERQGYEAFKNVFLDLLDALISRQTLVPYETDAHGSMEMIYRAVDESTAYLQLINLSGMNGVTIAQPVVQRDITVQLQKIPTRVEQMTADGLREIAVNDRTFVIDRCGIGEAYLIHY